MALTAAEEAQTRELLAQQAAILSLADSEPAILSNLGATDVSLSDLAAATVIGDSDLLLIRQGVTDKSVNPLVLDGRYVKKSGDTMLGLLSGPNPATGNRSTLYATMQKFADEFVSSLSSFGYQKFPSGLIIQWQTPIYPTSGVITWTFPITFTNAIISTWGGTSPGSSVDFTSRTIGPWNYTNSFAQFAVTAGGVAASNSVGCQVFSIGY